MCNREPEISLDDFRFMTSILIKSFEPNVVLAEFSDWWKENVGGDFNYDLLSSDENNLYKRKLDVARELGPDEWSLGTSFVGYCPKSREAYREAKQLICDSDLVLH